MRLSRRMCLFLAPHYSGSSIMKKIAGVGDIVTHKSNEKHWTKMNNGFLLALAIWKGTDLGVNPTIFSRDSTKMYEVKEKKDG